MKSRCRKQQILGLRWDEWANFWHDQFWCRDTCVPHFTHTVYPCSQVSCGVYISQVKAKPCLLFGDLVLTADRSRGPVHVGQTWCVISGRVRMRRGCKNLPRRGVFKFSSWFDAAWEVTCSELTSRLPAVGSGKEYLIEFHTATHNASSQNDTPWQKRGRTHSRRLPQRVRDSSHY